MTFDINPWFGATVTHGERVGNNWTASAEVFGRDTQETLGATIYAKGESRAIAEDSALENAKNDIARREIPFDWSGPTGGFPALHSF